MSRIDIKTTPPHQHVGNSFMMAIHDITKKHFEATANTPKSPWMSPETGEQYIHRRDILSMLDRDKENKVLRDEEKLAHKRARGLSRQDKKRAMIDIANDMIDSAEHRDYRTVWIRGREFAKTGLGPKRRVYTPPDPEVISAQEWDAYRTSSRLLEWMNRT